MNRGAPYVLGLAVWMSRACGGEAAQHDDAVDADQTEVDEPDDVPIWRPPDSEVVWATDGVFVSTNGSDELGDGSREHPLRTVQAGVERAGEGGVVLVEPGIYDGHVRIGASRLTLQSVESESNARAHVRCPVSRDEETPTSCIEVETETAGVTLRGLEVSGGFYGVVLGTRRDADRAPLDKLAAREVTIEDCVLHDTGGDAIKVLAGTDAVRIRRVEVYGSGAGVDTVKADRLHISDSYVHDIAATCVSVTGGSSETVIERLRVERCGELGITLGSETSSPWFDSDDNPDHYEVVAGRVRNCIVADTGLAGLALYSTRDAALLHNTVIDAGRRGHAGIYLGVAPRDLTPSAGRPPNLRPTIIGNIVDQGALAEPVCFAIRHLAEDGELGPLDGLSGTSTIHDNLYWSDATCRFYDARPSAPVDGDFAAWQASGFDAESRFVQPRLAPDGRLLRGSPAIDATLATPDVVDDFDARPRTPPFDLGADELGPETRAFVRKIELEVASGDWKRLHDHIHDAIEIPVAVVIDGRRFDGGTLEAHGGYAREVPKKSYRVELPDEPDADIDLFGDGLETQRRFVLKAGWIDRSFLREAITLEMVREAGGLAPRLAYAEVWVAGELLGFYQVVERIDRPYFKRHGLADEMIQVYKAEYHAANWAAKPDPLQGYDIQIGDTDVSDLKDLLDALSNTPTNAGAFAAEVAPRLALNDVLVFQRIHTFVANRDTFTKNYYLYHERSAAPGTPEARFRVVSWDADAVFGNEWEGTVLPGDDRHWHGTDAFSPRLFAVPEWRARYLDDYARALEAELLPARLHARVDALAAEIATFARADLAKWQPDFDWDAEIVRLKKMLDQRHEMMRALIDEIR